MYQNEAGLFQMPQSNSWVSVVPLTIQLPKIASLTPYEEYIEWGGIFSVAFIQFLILQLPFQKWRHALCETSACSFFGVLFIVNEWPPRAEDRCRATRLSDDLREFMKEEAMKKTEEMT